MAKYKVNAGHQVNLNGVVYESGDTFEATDDEVAPLAAWVTRTRAAASADTKAQRSSANKAVKSSANKSTK